jgi:hypothetical protein
LKGSLRVVNSPPFEEGVAASAGVVGCESRRRENHPVSSKPLTPLLRKEGNRRTRDRAGSVVGQNFWRREMAGRPGGNALGQYARPKLKICAREFECNGRTFFDWSKKRFFGQRAS